MTETARVWISAELVQRLQDEADRRGIPMAELASTVIEQGLDRIPPVPWADERG